MPPRKKARGASGAQAVATEPPTATAPADDAMDVDTPTTGDAKSASPEDPEARKQNECWTDDQVCSLFKGVIRWKPAGMHKHFRMIAISEHLRNHGFDPDYHKHTRIPYIWQKLRTFYNLEIIDERENFEEDEPEDRYKVFALPSDIFGEAMYQRRFADATDPPSSPPQLDLENGPSSPAKKRKRGDTTSRTRGSSREETEDATDVQSPTERSTRGSRGRTRAASAAQPEKADTTEDEEGEEEDDDGEESGTGEEEVGDSEADTATQSTKSAKGAPRTRGRAATRSSRRKK